ncbi:hypothetical protein ACEWY4_026360 [Coilia grayii]|uniref:CRIB domain-containing protein n=1 Tax=Coilia grayii TaxID=363190 RepID=A0ABD1IXF2_9TELE
MPILKQLVSSSSQSKRRSRADLTPEMISAPLGDFRHTMHVGRGGDTFGDTSFLSSRSGEPPRQPAADAFHLQAPPPPHHQQQLHHHHHHPHPHQPPPPPPTESPPPPAHKPSLLSRTFRSSKRSQSVNRTDKHKPTATSSSSSNIMVSTATMPGNGNGNGSPTHVKTAISLPYLNEGGGLSGGLSLAKSVSSSPLKRFPGAGPDGPDVMDGRKPANGAAAAAVLGTPLLPMAMQEPDLLEAERERRFGDLTDLPPSLPRAGGMKHAESIMSFHIDLGPSMLGDILSVMDKRGWDEDDLGFEEGRASPLPLGSPPRGGDDHIVVGGFGGGSDDNDAPSRPPRTSSSSIRPQQHMDSCSVSSSGSTVQEDRTCGPSGHGYPRHHNHSQSHSETDGDSARFSSPGRARDDERDFSFMDDEDEDEIRV